MYIVDFTKHGHLRTRLQGYVSYKHPLQTRFFFTVTLNEAAEQSAKHTQICNRRIIVDYVIREKRRGRGKIAKKGTIIFLSRYTERKRKVEVKVGTSEWHFVWPTGLLFCTMHAGVIALKRGNSLSASRMVLNKEGLLVFEQVQNGYTR